MIQYFAEVQFHRFVPFTLLFTGKTSIIKLQTLSVHWKPYEGIMENEC
jgi:hypothetical protein